jgi:hypothetical protein
VPQAEASLLGTTGVWSSRRDNPRITGGQPLFSWESAQVSNTPAPGGVNFDLFNLWARTVRTNTGMSSTLWTFPTANAFPSTSMTWIARGLQLPRRTGTVTQDRMELDAIYDNRSVTLGAVPATAKCNVVLDPNVHLVPIHVIQLYSPAANYLNGWASQNMASVVLDDAALADQHINTTPTTNPDSVLYTWLPAGRDEAVNVLRPDEIWKQCDIQFRMVAYTACPVAANVMVSQDTTCTNNALTAQQQAALNAVDACTAASKKPGIRLIYTGRLEGPVCPAIGGITPQNSNDAVVAQPAVYAGSRTVAHELGHILNLGDLTGSNQTDRLMFNQSNAAGPENLLTTSDCSTARSAAITKQTAWNPP